MSNSTKILDHFYYEGEAKYTILEDANKNIPSLTKNVSKEYFQSNPKIIVDYWEQYSERLKAIANEKQKLSPAPATTESNKNYQNTQNNQNIDIDMERKANTLKAEYEFYQGKVAQLNKQVFEMGGEKENLESEILKQKQALHDIQEKWKNANLALTELQKNITKESEKYKNLQKQIQNAEQKQKSLAAPATKIRQIKQQEEDEERKQMLKQVLYIEQQQEKKKLGEQKNKEQHSNSAQSSQHYTSSLANTNTVHSSSQTFTAPLINQTPKIETPKQNVINPNESKEFPDQEKPSKNETNANSETKTSNISLEISKRNDNQSKEENNMENGKISQKTKDNDEKQVAQTTIQEKIMEVPKDDKKVAEWFFKIQEESMLEDSDYFFSNLKDRCSKQFQPIYGNVKRIHSEDEKPYLILSSNSSPYNKVLVSNSLLSGLFRNIQKEGIINESEDVFNDI